MRKDYIFTRMNAFWELVSRYFSASTLLIIVGLIFQLFSLGEKQHLKPNTRKIINILLLALIALFSLLEKSADQQQVDLLMTNNKALLESSDTTKLLVRETRLLAQTTKITTQKILERNEQLQNTVDSLNFFSVEYKPLSKTIKSNIVRKLSKLSKSEPLHPIIRLEHPQSPALNKVRENLFLLFNEANLKAQIVYAESRVVFGGIPFSIIVNCNQENQAFAKKIINALLPYLNGDVSFEGPSTWDNNAISISLAGNPFYDKNGCLYIR